MTTDHHSIQTFSHIVLMGRPGVTGVPETLTAIIHHLKTLDKKIYIEETTTKLIDLSKHSDVIPVHHASLPQQSDLIIVVGGDGSLLNAAHIALPYQLPVLGINRGRLGFLTDIHPHELNKVSDVLEGRYVEEKRFLLNTKVIDKHKKNIQNNGLALNEVVLGAQVQMMEFEIHINGDFVCRQRADGLIITTPTGSTAYALSGGGPILHPELNAIALVPMFPHTLSSRPIVVHGNSMIEIEANTRSHQSAHISCDGVGQIEFPDHMRLQVEKSPDMLRLIHPKDYDYYSTLREKLSWEKQAVQ